MGRAAESASRDAPCPPGTFRRDRGAKLRLYAEAGVREVWFVDAAEREFEFLVNEDGRLVVAVPEGPVYRSAALPEIELDVEAFWGEVGETFGG